MKNVTRNLGTLDRNLQYFHHNFIFFNILQSKEPRRNYV